MILTALITSSIGCPRQLSGEDSVERKPPSLSLAANDTCGEVGLQFAFTTTNIGGLASTYVQPYVLESRSTNPRMMFSPGLLCTPAQSGDLLYTTNFDGLSGTVSGFGVEKIALNDFNDFALMNACFEVSLTGGSPSACSGP